jgi:hypothetical protein
MVGHVQNKILTHNSQADEPDITLFSHGTSFKIYMVLTIKRKKSGKATENLPGQHHCLLILHIKLLHDL